MFFALGFAVPNGLAADATETAMEEFFAQWFPLIVIAAFLVFACVANMVESRRKGKKCIMHRLVLVCRNEARKIKLRRALEMEPLTREVRVRVQ